MFSCCTIACSQLKPVISNQDVLIIGELQLQCHIDQGQTQTKKIFFCSVTMSAVSEDNKELFPSTLLKDLELLEGNNQFEPCEVK